MKIMIASIVAAPLLLTGGVSLAQTDSIMSDKTVMGPFFTDETMATLRSDEELQAELAKMSPENRQKFIEECKKPAEHEQMYNELCKKISPQ
jgi:hypothetical protein